MEADNQHNMAVTGSASLDLPPLSLMDPLTSDSSTKQSNLREKDRLEMKETETFDPASVEHVKTEIDDAEKNTSESDSQHFTTPQQNINVEGGSRKAMDAGTDRQMDNYIEKTDMAAGQKQMSETGACHFNIGSLDIFNQWWGIGSARGLTTDTEIASFLIALYENTESAVQSAARCIHCHTPLTLVCTKCQRTHKRTPDGKPNIGRSVETSESLSDSFMISGSTRDTDGADSGELFGSSSAIDPKAFATSSVQADTWDSLMSSTFSGSRKKKKTIGGRKFTATKSGSLKVKGFGKIKRKVKAKPPEPSVPSENEDDGAEDDQNALVPSDIDAVKTALSAVVSSSDGRLVKKYACDVCDAAFARSTHLKRHQRIHTGERPYVCPECGHSFTRSTHLKRHELIHTRPKPEKRERSGPSQPRPKKPKPPGNEKPFVCEECGSAFGSSTDLKIHRRIHTGEKPYLCKDCGAAFITSGNLRRHERTHSGDRPYLCQECCASFTRSADLSRHMKCHAGEKSYFCKECGAGFASFSFLRMHKRTHLEDMPYVCGLCNAAFCTSGSLKRHSQSHYGDIPMVY